MYNKLFTKILDSSIWLEPTTTRIVWITLLAAMDEDGYAHFSAIENLAARARVTKEEASIAIECFLSPDHNSANPDNEGRRIEKVPGGYMILNAKAHRDAVTRIIQREQTRVRVARHRSKLKIQGGNVMCNGDVTLPSASDTASVRKESAERKPTKYPSEAFKAMKLIEKDLQEIKESGSDSKWRDRTGALTEAGKVEWKRLRDLLAKNKEIACR